MVKLVPYTPDMRDEIVALLGAGDAKTAIWSWQYERPATGGIFDPVVVVDENRIVGFNGMMPVEIHYVDRSVAALWSCDFVVASDRRGQGLGRRIKEWLIERSPLIMSMGISKLAEPVLARSGWRPCREVRKYHLLRRPNSMRDRSLAALQAVNRFLGRAKPRASAVVRCRDHLPPSDVVDGLWLQCRDQYGKAVCRHAPYMNWRYLGHPLATYQFWHVDGAAGLRALLVTRDDGSMMRIVDYLGDLDASLLRVVFEQVLAQAPQYDRFSCITSSPILSRALTDSGFFKLRTRPGFVVRSSLPGDRDCERGWFVMAGDSDGEMLRAAGKGWREMVSGGNRTNNERMI